MKDADVALDAEEDFFATTLDLVVVVDLFFYCFFFISIFSWFRGRKNWGIGDSAHNVSIQS